MNKKNLDNLNVNTIFQQICKEMAEKPITDIGKVFKDKDVAYRIYIGKQIADAAPFENKEKKLLIS